jgi:hypothetical protein
MSNIKIGIPDPYKIKFIDNYGSIVESPYLSKTPLTDFFIKTDLFFNGITKTYLQFKIDPSTFETQTDFTFQKNQYNIIKDPAFGKKTIKFQFDFLLTDVAQFLSILNEHAIRSNIPLQIVVDLEMNNPFEENSSDWKKQGLFYEGYFDIPLIPKGY